MVSGPIKAAIGAVATVAELAGEATRQLVRPPVMDDYVPPLPPPPEPVEGPPVPLVSVQFGLKLPNGNVIWDDSRFCGAPLSTPEERTAILESLRLEAHQLGFDEECFLAQYAWVKRIGLPSMAWGQPELIPITGEEPEQPQEEGTLTSPENLAEANNDENLLPT